METQTHNGKQIRNSSHEHFSRLFFGSVFPLHSAQYKIHTYIGLYIRGDYGQPIRSDPRQSQNEN